MMDGQPLFLGPPIPFLRKDWVTKRILQSTPVLTAPDCNVPFELAVDARHVAAGAVLSHNKAKMGLTTQLATFREILTKIRRISQLFTKKV